MLEYTDKRPQNMFFVCLCEMRKPLPYYELVLETLTQKGSIQRQLGARENRTQPHLAITDPHATSLAPYLLDGLEGVLEEVCVELLEARARERLGEVDAVEEGLDLDARLVGGGERALGLLHLAAQLLQRALVAGEVLAVLLLEGLNGRRH
eukprot:gene78-biopygen22